MRLIRERRPEVIGDIPPGRHPNVGLVSDVFHKVAQRLASTRLADNTSMQRNVHHLAAFAVQHVECVLEVILVALNHARAEAGRHVEFPIVAVILAQCVSMFCNRMV